MAKIKLTEPKESVIQESVARYLDAIGVLWCHVPNGGARDPVTGAILRRQGVKKGVPDILIFDPPPGDNGYIASYVGTAIELKSKGGKKSPEQSKWLDELDKRGWLTLTCYGIDDAISSLMEWGYDKFLKKGLQKR